MRLTLRTLLAWLDDTLQPAEVREIGQQVAESPFAQELSQRIHRVSRQRRLAVPSRSGPDGTDPNVVAAYLDNDLDPDDVAEFEKKCLTSDVNLAEVASVHQILSLLGQKVKVPVEARARMYQLVKGRESNVPARGEPKPPPAPEPVTEPIESWAIPDRPARPWSERFGPLAACAGLLLVASWSAFKSVTAPPPQATLVMGDLEPLPATERAAAADKPDAPIEGIATDTDSPPGREANVPPVTPAAGAATTTAATTPAETIANATAPAADEAGAAKASKAAEPLIKLHDTASAQEVPSGASGLALSESAEGVLLRYDNDDREWKRITGAAPLNRPDRLLSLAPFRANLLIGKVPIVLVGETEVRIVSQPGDKTPAFELAQGRVLVRHAPKGSLRVAFADRIITLDLSPEDTLTLARPHQRMASGTAAPVPSLELYCMEGEPSLEGDNKGESLAASTAMSVDSSGKIKRATLLSPPSWAVMGEPSSDESHLASAFARMFHPGRPILAEVVAASEDEHAEIKQLSIAAIKAMGDLSLLMPILSRKDDPVARRGVISAVRAYLAGGPAALKLVREQLVEEFGDDTGTRLLKMLVGYSREEAASPEVHKRLVDWLAPDQESVGLRELALDTLKHLTSRGDLGYDPDHPEGKGLAAWRDLLARGEIRPATKGSATN